jgi:apolipoprotein N-acyltransferase
MGMEYNHSVNRTFRIIKLLFLVTGILLLVAIPIAGLVSTANTYQGVCLDSSTGEHPCTWMQYAGSEMFWASFIFIPYLFLLSIAWLGMSAVQFVVEIREKRKKKTGEPERQ